MAENNDERKRAHLRLVVNNVEKRSSHPEDGGEDVIPFEELAGMRDVMRPEFYRDLGGKPTKAYESLERFIALKGWPYGLDPQHGKILVLPAGVIAPEAMEYGISFLDEVLLFISEDVTGKGLCLSLEMVMPFYSEDDVVMEDSLLYAPMLPYGTLFLEENRQDGFLDLIYRLAFPLFPPTPSGNLFDRLFSVAAYELKEMMRNLAENPES